MNTNSEIKAPHNQNLSLLKTNLDLSLSGQFIDLEPLNFSHVSELFQASREPEIWTYLPCKYPLSLEDMQQFVSLALHAREQGLELPFVIRQRNSGKVVGMTRYLDIQPQNRSLEIGWTWIAPEFQRSIVNNEAKYLLLKYAFEEMGSLRVQLKADERNKKSLAAIDRIGATREGTMRQHRILPDGFIRNTVLFSIIDSEWPEVKQQLQGLLARSVGLMYQPLLTRINLYPIKSLGALTVTQATIGSRGALLLDREWRIINRENNQVVNAKRYPVLHRLSTQYVPGQDTLALTICDRFAHETTRDNTPAPSQIPATLHSTLPDDQAKIAAWLSSYLGFNVDLERNPAGFPDDEDASGPTIISVATLNAIALYFEISLEEARRRFRSNIEIDAPNLPAFWEDCLFGKADSNVSFAINASNLSGTNPCQRCAVPARSADSGAPDLKFQKRFAEFRKLMLPNWANETRFNHYYRLAVNSNVLPDSFGNNISVGDILIRKLCLDSPGHESIRAKLIQR